MIELKFRPQELAPEDRLRRLEKQYRRSRQKWLFIAAIPVLWAIGAIPLFSLGYSWLGPVYTAWCILVVFAIGAYVIFRFPVADEVEHEHAQVILPGLLTKLGVEAAAVHKRHNLSTKTLLDAGLYYGKYNAWLREDCIQGTISGFNFGMYETAIQIASTAGGGYDRTNEFYGWFIAVNIRPLQGFHFITMRRRVNSGESDDWHRKTLSHWENDRQLQKIASGNKEFDEAFRLNTDHPAALMSRLDDAAMDFLLYLARTTKNSFALSIQRSHIFLLIGHEGANLRRSRKGDFTLDYSDEIAEEVHWYIEAIKSLAKSFSPK